MPSIEVSLSPDLLSMLELKGKVAVVVDVLRATSCMATGLDSGVDHIIPFTDVEECQSMKKEGYITAGERNGQLIPGMDMGNSPFDYMKKSMRGAKVAATTTNGTRSIHMSVEADHIITGAFLNFSSVVDYIRKKELPIVVVCAGWKGKVNLEDSLFAGALVNALSDKWEAADDSANLMLWTYQQIGDDIKSVIRNSEHAKRLGAFDIVEDIDYCAQWDKHMVVPEFINGKLIPASV